MPTLTRPFTLGSLRTWAKSEIDSGRPRGNVHKELATAFSDASELEEMEGRFQVPSATGE